MRRSSCAGSRCGGFTLTELVIATAVVSLLLTSICGIYFSVSKEWEREQGEAAALSAASLTCSKLADYISQADGASVTTRFVANDALALNMPANSAYGVYVPVWSGGKLQYASGNWIIFYLSNPSGNYNVAGSILWAASLTQTWFGWTVNPDQSWSLYYNTSQGRIAPLTSLNFVLDSSGARPAVTITAISTYRIGSTTKQISISRTVCLKNAN